MFKALIINNKTAVCVLKSVILRYSYIYTTFVPAAESLFLLILSILAVEFADFVHVLYKHFLFKVTEESLNAFYYVWSYAQIVTAHLALSLILEKFRNDTVFFVSMIFGRKFENVSKLFDHTLTMTQVILMGIVLQV